MSASAESLAAYQAALNAIESGKAAVDSVFKKAGDASSTLCDVNQRASQVQNMTVVRNRSGEVIGYDYRYTTPTQPDTSMMEINSNSDSGMYSTGGGGQGSGQGAGRYSGSNYAGSVDNDPQSTDKMKGSGLVSGLISSAWAGVSALSKLGKSVASTTGEALASLAEGFGEAFGDFCVDMGEATADSVRALFGVDSQGNTTMYLDEDVIGALAISARDTGFFNQAAEEITSPPADFPVSGCTLTGPVYRIPFDNTTEILPYGPTEALISKHISKATVYTYYAFRECDIIGPGLQPNGSSSPTSGYIMIYRINDKQVYVMTVSDEPFAIGSGTYKSIPEVPYLDGPGSMTTSHAVTYNNKSAYYWIGSATWAGNVQEGSTVILQEHTYSGQFPVIKNNQYQQGALAWYIMYGQGWEGGSMIPGTSTQPGATVPVDAITGADPHVVAQNLASNYSQIMGSPVQIVTMDDSCNEVVKNYYSVPISYSPTNLNINAPITGGLQVSPSFNPDVTLDLPDINMDNYIDQVIKIVGGSGAGRDVTIEPTSDTNPDIQPDTPSIDIPESGTSVVVPDTGSGTAPTPTTPTMLPTELWHVYRCTKTILDLFGQWLWGPAFDIELFKRLFSNPMDAVFGVHAIYAVPHVSGDDNIVCGNIASNVEASVIDEQYTTVTCGSVWLTEYFGNVFDYEPYTSVSIYLPFIGIVPLSVADVMRSNITVTYKVDVFTGACVAQISVLRDGVGGVIYEFSGNCSVGLPISGASYNNILSSMLSLTSGLGIAALSAGAGTPIGVAHGLSTAASSLTSARETVTRSGSFSGNIGAMGLKKPYLIISRPITEMATNFELFDGLPANKQVRLSDCSGYTKCKEVHFSAIGAYKSEQDEIENLLRSGVIL